MAGGGGGGGGPAATLFDYVKTKFDPRKRNAEKGGGRGKERSHSSRQRNSSSQRDSDGETAAERAFNRQQTAERAFNRQQTAERAFNRQEMDFPALCQRPKDAGSRVSADDSHANEAEGRLPTRVEMTETTEND